MERFHRVLFHELTKRAIAKAVAEPEKVNVNRFASQQARRILDRLVGYQISPLLWDKVRRGLSAGRGAVGGLAAWWWSAKGPSTPLIPRNIGT